MSIEKIGLNSFSAPTQQKTAFSANTNVSDKQAEKFDKKKAAAIGGVAALAVASLGAVYAVTKGKNIKLKNISFDNGVASRHGKKFSGTIKDVLKNGDNIELTYKDGIIQKSLRTNGDKVIADKTFMYGTEYGDVIISKDNVKNLRQIQTRALKDDKIVTEVFEGKTRPQGNELFRQIRKMVQDKDGNFEELRDIRYRLPDGTSARHFALRPEGSDTITHYVSRRSGIPLALTQDKDSNRLVVRIAGKTDDIAEDMATRAARNTASIWSQKVK